MDQKFFIEQRSAEEKLTALDIYENLDVEQGSKLHNDLMKGVEKEARYQEFEPEQIPVEETGDGTVIRVVAGRTANGTEGAVTQIAAQPIYFDVTLPPGGSFHQPIPPAHNAFVKMIEGRLAVDHEELVTGSLAVLGEGDQLQADAREEGARFLLIAGKPFNEPVVRSGPFVMNTDEELRQAYVDYQNGDFGRVE